MTAVVESTAKIKPTTSCGLECRKCGCRHFLVDHTRKVNHMIIRYRRCRHCGTRMTTCERAIG